MTTRARPADVLDTERRIVEALELLESCTAAVERIDRVLAFDFKHALIKLDAVTSALAFNEDGERLPGSIYPVTR